MKVPRQLFPTATMRMGRRRMCLDAERGGDEMEHVKYLPEVASCQDLFRVSYHNHVMNVLV